MNSATLFPVGEICFCEGNLCGVNKFQPCSQLWTSTCILFSCPLSPQKNDQRQVETVFCTFWEVQWPCIKEGAWTGFQKSGQEGATTAKQEFFKEKNYVYIYIYTYDIITYMKHKYMLGKMTWKGGGCQRPLFRSGLFPGVNCPHHPKQEGIQATWHQRSRHCCFSFCSCFCLVDVWGNTALVSCLWLLVSRKVLGFFVCSSFWCVRS